MRVEEFHKLLEKSILKCGNIGLYSRARVIDSESTIVILGIEYDIVAYGKERTRRHVSLHLAYFQNHSFGFIQCANRKIDRGGSPSDRSIHGHGCGFWPS